MLWVHRGRLHPHVSLCPPTGPARAAESLRETQSPSVADSLSLSLIPSSPLLALAPPQSRWWPRCSYSRPRPLWHSPVPRRAREWTGEEGCSNAHQPVLFLLPTARTRRQAPRQPARRVSWDPGIPSGRHAGTEELKHSNAKQIRRRTLPPIDGPSIVHPNALFLASTSHRHPSEPPLTLSTTVSSRSAPTTPWPTPTRTRSPVPTW